MLSPVFGAAVAGLILCGAGSAGSAGAAYSVVLQPNGKIVVAGSGQRGTQDVFGLARYTPGGSLDTSFGLRGKVALPVGILSQAFAVARQADGKLVAAGYSARNRIASTMKFGLARYTTAGALDTSFGSKGRVSTSFEPARSSAGSLAGAVAIQPNGKIVAGGTDLPDSFALARYNANGSLDTSFGTGGLVRTSLGTPDASASAMTLQNDGKIVVAGTAGKDFVLVRYRPDGSLDPSFGSGGIVTTSLGMGAGVNALALQPDGKIVVAGLEEFAGPPTFTSFALARYNPDGSLDTTFGSGGTVTTSFVDCGGSDYCGSAANALAIQPDGRIVAAGQSCAEPCIFALARYNPDGSLDGGFGSAGKVTTSFGYPTPEMGSVWGDYAQALALQADGKIVAAGYSQFGPHVGLSRVALARYLPDGSLDPAFGQAGEVKTSLALCAVPQLRGMKMDWHARNALRLNHCAVGKITRVHSRIKRRRIISERPRPGTVHAERTKIRLVVSLGRR